MLITFKGQFGLRKLNCQLNSHLLMLIVLKILMYYFKNYLILFIVLKTQINL